MAEEALQAARAAVEVCFSGGAGGFSFSLKIDSPWLAAGIAIGTFYLANKVLTERAIKNSLQGDETYFGNADPEVTGISTGSILVQLTCYTVDSLKRFTNDINSKKAKYRLEEELAKVGFSEKIRLTVEKFEVVRVCQDLDELLSKICKQDKLLEEQAKLKCLHFLSDVEIPSGWEDSKSYKLNEQHPTYKYRLQILMFFVRKKVEEDVIITSKTSKEFFDELKRFLWESYSTIDDDRLWEPVHDQKGSAGVDLFLQNVKLEGVVVRKSEKRKKVSVLVKKEGLRTSTVHTTTSDFTLSELVVSLENEGQTGDEFHLNMAVGDIVEVKKCRRKEGEGWEPEIVMCHSLSDVEIQSYLKSLSCCVQSDHATAAVIEITRCRAVWNYILNLSKEKYDMLEDITMQILETVKKICSSALMTHTVKEIIRGFQESEFFRTVFPEFIDSVKKEIHFRQAMLNS